MTYRPSQERLTVQGALARGQDIVDEMCPPEPQLLDTCVLQNLDWVDRQRERAGTVVWDDDAVRSLERRYGSELASDLLDLGTLYTQFEARSGYPWLACRASVDEATRLLGARGPRLREMIEFLIRHQDEWTDDAYAGLAKGLLARSGRRRVSPLILKALGVASEEEIHTDNGPLAFLPDLGDRLIAACALTANIPVILTTDLATFWKHRESMASLGVQVMRPSELLPLYDRYWAALDAQGARDSSTNASQHK